MDPAFNMDMDDLFEDPEHVALRTMTAPPPLKGLMRRLDDLASNGCCQKIAWSNNGCVAYISPDGQEINLKVFSRDHRSGKWHLGKNVPLESPPGREVFPFVHLSWSHLGNDLAVTDEAGHVMIFTCVMALDRLHFVRAELVYPESEADAVVGMHWLAILPHEQKNHIAWSAEREKGKWKWNIKSHMFYDAHHPLEGKASLIYLKRFGELKLRFQQIDNIWHEASAPLGNLISSKELFTHAAFASNMDETLLLAAYDVKRRMHLYRIEISWKAPPEKRAPNPEPIEKPIIQVSLIAIEENCDPVDTGAASLSGGTESKNMVTAQLTHLHFLPETPDENDSSSPTVQAIFCRSPKLAFVGQLSPQETPHSIVVKWEVHHSRRPQLHSSLDQVTSKKKSIASVPSRDVFLLSRQPDFTLHSIVLAFYPRWYNMLLAFCYSDGVLEFRNHATMESIIPDNKTETVSSLMQAGFVFPPVNTALHIGLSPNNCVAASMQYDGSIKLQFMEYQHGSLLADNGDGDARHSAALVALTLQSSSAANQYHSSDDIFAILGSLSEKNKQEFTTLLFDGLQVNIDCGVDDTSNNHIILLGRNPFFVKTLSAMNLLGLQGTANRSLTSKMAWIILNIKYVTHSLTMITRMHHSVEKTSLRPEVVPQFIGICRWIMHFMAYMLDELFAIGRAIESIPSASLTRSVVEAKIHELNKSAVLLLLSAFPRAMMKLWSQPIAWVERSAKAFTTASTPSPEMRRLYTPLQIAVCELPFKWRLFEVLVSEVQSLVRGIYKKANVNESQRNLFEREILLGKIPDILFPVAKRLVTDTLWNSSQQGGCLVDKLDLGRLMFFDTTWLGFQESKRATIWHDTHVVDICQKMIIRGIGTQTHPSLSSQQQQQQRSNRPDGPAPDRKTQRLRQCVRCGEHMEDVVQGLAGYAPHHASWLMGVAKHCICGSCWMLADEKMNSGSA